jgi:hypothetical protein
MHSYLDNLKRSDAPAGMQNAHLHNEAPVRVLVVDDSRTSADALSAYLQAGGMSVLTVYHGPDALRESKGLDPGLHCSGRRRARSIRHRWCWRVGWDRCQGGAQRTVPYPDRFGV